MNLVSPVYQFLSTAMHFWDITIVKTGWSQQNLSMFTLALNSKWHIKRYCFLLHQKTCLSFINITFPSINIPSFNIWIRTANNVCNSEVIDWISISEVKMCSEFELRPFFFDIERFYQLSYLRTIIKPHTFFFSRYWLVHSFLQSSRERF